MNDLTPNVVVENPTVRRWAQIILSVVGIFLSSALVLDSQMPGVDWSSWINPSYALYGFLAATFGLAVVSPNIPRHSAAEVKTTQTAAVQEISGESYKG